MIMIKGYHDHDDDDYDADNYYNNNNNDKNNDINDNDASNLTLQYDNYDDSCSYTSYITKLTHE